MIRLPKNFSNKNLSTKKKNKFNAKKVELDGFKFDSRGEMLHYCKLKDLERSGEIENLELHPAYKMIINNRLVCKMIPDFRYEKEGRIVIEDFKSKATITRAYRIKKKLLAALYNIEIKEVYR